MWIPRSFTLRCPDPEARASSVGVILNSRTLYVNRTACDNELAKNALKKFNLKVGRGKDLSYNYSNLEHQNHKSATGARTGELEEWNVSQLAGVWRSSWGVPGRNYGLV